MKTGDRVILNSGSPIMTVKEITEKTVICTWYDAAKTPSIMQQPQMSNFQEAEFLAETLIVIQERK